LLKAGWRMQEIDGMDMLGFLRLRAWDVQREHEQQQLKLGYIDQLWPSIKPSGA